MSFHISKYLFIVQQLLILSLELLFDPLDYISHSYNPHLTSYLILSTFPFIFIKLILNPISLCFSFITEAIARRDSADYNMAVFALAVLNVETRVGLELCGNAVAVKQKLIVTAFHNIYDEFPHDYDQSADSTDEFSFQEAYNMESKKPVVIRIFKNAIISRMVIKKGDEDQEEFKSPILLRFVEGDYSDDWAVLEVVSTVHSYCGILVNQIPSDFKFLHICPDDKLPVAGINKLKGYHFDIAGYKASEDEEETLNCQRVEYSLVTMYKPKSRVYRMQGSLNFGSCGSPSINNKGYLVAIHLASLDSTMTRQRKTRFRIMIDTGAKRRKLTSANLKLTSASLQKLVAESDEHFDVYEEQSRILDEVSSRGEAFNSYKEAFVLRKSTTFMELLKTYDEKP